VGTGKFSRGMQFEIFKDVDPHPPNMFGLFLFKKFESATAYDLVYN
jgi:hypothetical protein